MNVILPGLLVFAAIGLAWFWFESNWDRNKPVLIYCAGGFRSRRAAGVVRALGFQSIHHLHRGYLSWPMARLPVVKKAGTG